MKWPTEQEIKDLQDQIHQKLARLQNLHEEQRKITPAVSAREFYKEMGNIKEDFLEKEEIKEEKEEKETHNKDEEITLESNKLTIRELQDLARKYREKKAPKTKVITSPYSLHARRGIVDNASGKTIELRDIDTSIITTIQKYHPKLADALILLRQATSKNCYDSYSTLSTEEPIGYKTLDGDDNKANMRHYDSSPEIHLGFESFYINNPCPLYVAINIWPSADKILKLIDKETLRVEEVLKEKQEITSKLNNTFAKLKVIKLL